MKNELKNIISELEGNLDFVKKSNEIQIGLKEISRKLDSNEILENDQKILEITFLITRVCLELSYIKKNLIGSETKNEEKYFIKLAYLNIYEAVNSYNKKITIIKEFIPNEYYDKQLKELNKILTKFKIEYEFEKKIKSVRNKIIAHFESDINEYFRVIEQLDRNNCIQMINTFSLFYIFILNYITDLYRITVKPLPKDFDFETFYKDAIKRLETEIQKIKNINLQGFDTMAD
ncbi:hypothetical protein [Myroides pelagicus]|uniref:HEPN AbiU2-like domain-containing protein n=1 Tax=Myroides pelagicus TaxID=270914 RepID=A0A7K1GN69_9FLAO|nr:hypothetical protein [Myroides pelagicus]MTH30327.1 hypothetical protein [Myroides pelagicus]